MNTSAFRPALLVASIGLAISPTTRALDPRPDGEYRNQNARDAANVIRYTTSDIKTFVRGREDMTIPRMITRQGDQSVAKVNAPLDTICGVKALAVYVEKAPRTSGGTLDPLAFFNPTTINSSGSVAFNALVDGSTRNQGVFVADSAGHLTAIAIGCGGYVVAEILLRVAAIVHRLAENSAVSFSGPILHPISMMRVTSFSSVM